MATQAEALAARFDEANNAMIRAVEGMSDEQWRVRCSSEGWPAGVVAHHVAVSHQGIIGLTQAVATGQQLPPLTREMIDQGNAQHAQEAAACTREETLRLLRENGGAAAQALRGLTDEQLGRTAPILGQPMTAAQIVENILIGHPQQHLASITATA